MPSEKHQKFFFSSFLLIPRAQNKDQAQEEKIQTATTSSVKCQAKGWNERTSTSVAAERGKIREKWCEWSRAELKESAFWVRR